MRSDSAAVDRSWPTRMNIYSGSYLSEPELLRRLGFAGATRTTIDASLNRYHYESADGTLEAFFDEGLDQPFHAVSFTRTAPPVPITWANPDELHQRWQEAATRAAAYVSLLTDLTPVIYVGDGSDAELADTLSLGTRFVVLLLLDGRLLWVGNLILRVDATGVYQFDTAAMPATTTLARTIQARTRDEVLAIGSAAGFGPPLLIPGIDDPIFYDFRPRTSREVVPMFFFERVEPVALDSADTPFPPR